MFRPRLALLGVWLGWGLSLCASNLLAVEPTPTPTPTGGRIVGRVLAADSGNLIAGATVHAVSDPPPGSLIPTLFFETHTDAQGFFQFQNVPARHYVIEAGADGFMPGQGELDVALGQTVGITLRLQRVSADLGRIQGTVSDAVTSQGLVGASVFYIRGAMQFGDELLSLPALWLFGMTPVSPPPTSPLPVPPHVQTGEHGFYMIPALEAGPYTLVVWSPGFIPQQRIVQVQSGHETTANFALRHTESPQTGVIEGMVVNASNGAPIAGAWVFIGPATEPGGEPTWLGSITSTTPHARTDEHGHYRIDGLPPGAYHLTAEAQGFHSAHADADVQAGGVTHVDFRLEPMEPPQFGSIAGRVTDAVTSQPIVGATIFFGLLLSPVGEPDWWMDVTPPELPHVTTGPDGRYLIDHLPPGSYHLLFTAPGYEPEHEEVDVQGGHQSVENVALEPLTPPAPGVIEGNVTDAGDHHPLMGARVFYQLLPENMEDLDDRSLDHSGVVTAGGDPSTPLFVTTDANGHYRIPNLMPGAYHLMAVAEDYQARSRIVQVAPGGVTQADFALEHGPGGMGTIFGRVIDALTTQPLAGAQVWVGPAGDVTIQSPAPSVVFGQAMTDENGDYRIMGIPVGEVRVTAAKDGYRTMRRTARVFADTPTKVDFALQPIPMHGGGNVVGTVRDASNERPIPGALVSLLPEDPIGFDLSRPPEPALMTLTDMDGQYAFPNVPPGRYHVAAAKEGFQRAVLETIVMDGGTSEVNFLLAPLHEPRFGSLAGHVVDAVTSAPLAHVWVRIEGDDSAWLAHADAMARLTDAQGFYLFERLHPGSYKVHAVRSDYEPARKPADVIAGQRTIVDFALVHVRGFGAIEGRITNALTDEPLSNTLVFVPLAPLPNSASDVSALHARSDADGRYRIEMVPSGERIVVAFHRGFFLDAQVAQVEPDQTVELDFALLPRMGHEATWRVQCLDGRNGRPLVGARVNVPLTRWFAPGSSWDPWSDVSDGSGAALVEGVPDGSWFVVGSAPGFVSLFAPLVDSGLGGPTTTALNAANVRTITLIFLPELSASAAREWMNYR